MKPSRETKQDEGEASSKHKKKLYLMGIPRSRKIVTSISMDPIGQPVKKLVKPRFLTKTIEDSALGSLSMDYAERCDKNSSDLLEAIKESLSCVSSNVCQMRVTLGSFVFSNYRRLKNPSAGYSIRDFDEMLRDEISRGHLRMGLDLDETLLLERISNASDLFDLLRASTIHHAVEIEFLPKGDKSLHLEVDFNLSGGHYEQFKSRWVEVNSQNRPLLQAVMLNPEKADWELKIREQTILGPNEIPNSKRQLPHQIRLRDGVGEETLSRQPRQRTIMPSTPEAHRLIEKATRRFPIEGTDHVLEVSRYDIYQATTMPARKVPARKVSVQPTPPMRFTHDRSYWEAEVVGRGWDQDMMDFRGMTPEQKIDAVFNQLFQQRPDETQRAAFERLIKVVTDVAGLWDQTDNDYTELMSTTSSDLQTNVNFVGGSVEGVLIELD